MRNGRFAAVPCANTVSVCAISRMRPLPVPVKLATMLSPTAGLAGENFDVGAKLAQFLDGDGADLHETVRVASAGIDVDQPLQQLERVVPGNAGRDRELACSAPQWPDRS